MGGSGSHSVGFGADFREEIQLTLTDVDALIVVIGQAFQVDRLGQANDYVRMEIAEALRLDKRIVPVLVDDAVMPVPEVLPAELQALSYRTAAPLRSDPDFDNDVRRLVEELRKQFEPDGPPPSDDREATPGGRDRRRAGVLVIAALLVVAVAAIAATLALSDGDDAATGSTTGIVATTTEAATTTALITTTQPVATLPVTAPPATLKVTTPSTAAPPATLPVTTPSTATSPDPDDTVPFGQPAPACASLLFVGQSVERVEFSRGSQSAVMNGVLRAGGADVFVLDVAGGQQLVLDALTEPESHLLMCVARTSGNQVLDAQLAASWRSGPVPARDDYFVLIAAPISLSYTLEIEVPPL